MPIQNSWQGATLGANTFTGAQAATSLALGGATIGARALSVVGSSEFTQRLVITNAGDPMIEFARSGGNTFSIQHDASQWYLYNNTTAAVALLVTNARAVSMPVSLAIGGATIGTNALAVTGAVLFTQPSGGRTFVFGADGNTTIPADRILFWSGLTGITTGVDGALIVRNNANSAGGTINAATDGTFKFFGRDGTTPAPIQIGNVVNSVSPTSPNRTVTMVIGGTTYYLAAKTTND